MSSNLPMVIQELGGDLAKIVGDIQRHTDPRYPLPLEAMYALGDMIDENPALNNTRDVDMLVNLMSWHGIVPVELDELLEIYSLRLIHLAAEYLREVGKISHGDYGHHLEQTIILIGGLLRSGVEVNDVDDLVSILDRRNARFQVQDQKASPNLN